MKDAPTDRQFTANLSTGYNSMYLNRDFQSFAWNKIQKKSPDERRGTTLKAVKLRLLTLMPLRCMSQKNTLCPILLQVFPTATVFSAIVLV